MDEKCFLKGQNYIIVLSDPEGKWILDIVQNKDTEAVDKLWDTLTDKQKGSVAAVSMDFWKAFINGAEKYIPTAQNNGMLKGTKYLWLKVKENLTKENKKDFKELNINQLSVGRVRNREELLRHIWDY